MANGNNRLLQVHKMQPRWKARDGVKAGADLAETTEALATATSARVMFIVIHEYYYIVGTILTLDTVLYLLLHCVVEMPH